MDRVGCRVKEGKGDLPTGHGVALSGLEGLDVYVNDVIIGFTWSTYDDLVANQYRALHAVMERLAHHDRKVNLRIAQMEESKR